MCAIAMSCLQARFSLIKHRREPEREFRKGKEQAPHDAERDQERSHSFVDLTHGLFRDVLDHEDADRHRRDDHPDHDHDADDDAEPERVEAELQDGRVEDGGRQDHEGEVIDEGAAELIDETDEEHDEVPVKGQAHDPVGRVLRDVGDGDEVAEDRGARDEHEEHARGPKRLGHGLGIAEELEVPLGDGQDEDREGADGPCLGGGEEALHDPADDEEEDEPDPGDLGQAPEPRVPGGLSDLGASLGLIFAQP